MAQDHFVAQTYLKHFGDSTRGGVLHGYRKRDGLQFPCWPKDVCREWDGDLNDLLQDKGLLGEYRRMVEPWWNESVANALQGKVSYHDKFVIALYMAHLMVCTPAWRRIGVSHHNQLLAMYLSFAKKMKEKHGGQPNLPVEAIAMIERGEIALDTDPDYIKALVTKNLMHYAWTIYNEDWSLIHADSAQSFLTSDNPVAMKYSWPADEIIRRFLPITPQLCLGVNFKAVVDPAAARLRPEELRAGLERPPQGIIHHVTGDEELCLHINRLQVQCAEDLVFSSRISEADRQLVEEYSRYRMDIECVQFPDPSGAEDSVIQGSILLVREIQWIVATQDSL
jgi:Protein of unknown function (DUF4238)